MQLPQRQLIQLRQLRFQRLVHGAAMTKATRYPVQARREANAEVGAVIPMTEMENRRFPPPVQVRLPRPFPVRGQVLLDVADPQVASEANRQARRTITTTPVTATRATRSLLRIKNLRHAVMSSTRHRLASIVGLRPGEHRVRNAAVPTVEGNEIARKEMTAEECHEENVANEVVPTVANAKSPIVVDAKARIVVGEKSRIVVGAKSQIAAEETRVLDAAATTTNRPRSWTIRTF